LKGPTEAGRSRDGGKKMDFLKDLWGFLKERKKFWLLPLIVIILIFGALMIFASGSAIAPFIYTLF
jgi:hypothetical protein